MKEREGQALLSIIVPTYNEKKNLSELIRRIERNLAGIPYEILIVDDSSIDGTADLARDLAGNSPIRLLQRGNKKGLASAILDGMNQASGDTLCFMDADLSHPPEKLLEMFEAITENKADLVIGSRWARGSRLDEKWPVQRYLDSHMAGLLVRPLTSVKDSMSGFMMMKKSVVEGVLLKPIGYKIGLEILVKGKYSKAIEIPILFLDRSEGTSKMNLRVKVQFLIHIARLYGEQLFQGRHR